MKLFAIDDFADDPAIFTPWSTIHFGAGLAGWCIGKRIFTKLSDFELILLLSSIHGIYESKDQLVRLHCMANYEENKRKTGRDGPKGLRDGRCINSAANSIGDQLIFTLGILFGKYLGSYTFTFINVIVIIIIALMILFVKLKWG